VPECRTQFCIKTLDAAHLPIPFHLRSLLASHTDAIIPKKVGIGMCK
jgi:hypothetical protein